MTLSSATDVHTIARAPGWPVSRRSHPRDCRAPLPPGPRERLHDRAPVAAMHRFLQKRCTPSVHGCLRTTGRERAQPTAPRHRGRGRRPGVVGIRDRCGGVRVDAGKSGRYRTRTDSRKARSDGGLRAMAKTDRCAHAGRAPLDSALQESSTHGPTSPLRPG